MKDEEKAKLFFELREISAFQAELALQEETSKSWQDKFLTIDPKSNVTFEHARVRGALEVLKQLKAGRDYLLELHRSRLKNS